MLLSGISSEYETKVKLSPFIKDIILTTVTSVVTGLSLIVITRLLTQGFGPEGFGVYSLARRVLSTVATFSTLAMGVSIARYIATSRDESSKLIFLLNGIILGVAPSLLLAFIGVTFRDTLSILVFHDRGYSLVFMAILFMLIGYSFYNILYAFYRGTGQMGRANLWQLAVIAFGPMIISGVYAKTGQIHWVLFLMGSLYFTAIVPLGIYVSRRMTLCKEALSILSPLKQLFHYGFPRVPGGLALDGMLVIGPFLAPYFGSLADTGYLLAAQSVFALVGSGVVAFGLLVLPKTAQLFVDGHVDFLRERIRDIVTLAIHSGTFIAIHLLLWTDQLILVWIGPNYLGVIPLMRILILALLPYLLYVLLRSIIDGVEERAINVRNLYTSLLVTTLVCLLLEKMGLGVRGLAIGTAVGFVVLGVTTVRYLWQAHWITMGTFHLKGCLWLNAGAFGIAFGFRYLTVPTMAPATAFKWIILLESVLGVLYLLMLRKLRVGWILQLEQRIVKGGAR